MPQCGCGGGGNPTALCGGGGGSPLSRRRRRRHHIVTRPDPRRRSRNSRPGLRTLHHFPLLLKPALRRRSRVQLNPTFVQQHTLSPRPRCRDALMNKHLQVVPALVVAVVAIHKRRAAYTPPLPWATLPLFHQYVLTPVLGHWSVIAVLHNPRQHHHAPMEPQVGQSSSLNGYGKPMIQKSFGPQPPKNLGGRRPPSFWMVLKLPSSLTQTP